MIQPDFRRSRLVLVAASLLCFVLGSVHAFSVFLLPLEEAFDAPRSKVSLTYSLALVALTLAVMTGNRSFVRLPAARFVIAVGLIGAGGALIAAVAPTLPMIWLGYSLLFGGANGLGYGFGLQAAAQANPAQEGRAMGIVTACYALGATAAPAMFNWALAAGGFRAAMIGLAAALVAAAAVCSWAMAKAAFEFQTAGAGPGADRVPVRSVAGLWLGYGAGAAAGLMAIGHATGIIREAGLQDALWVAPMLVALCNMCGSFVGGWLVDRTSPGALLAAIPGASAAALILLAVAKSAGAALIGLGLVGLAYGAIIAVYPAVIVKLFGALNSTRIYGRVFTAWGAAGLLAPWLAGWLFDSTGGYRIALTIAACAATLSAASALLLFRRDPAALPNC